MDQQSIEKRIKESWKPTIRINVVEENEVP